MKYTTNTLKKLEELLQQLAYTVRYEKGNFQSGYCIVEHRKIVIVNKFFETEARINSLIDIISTIPIEVNLTDEQQKWYNAAMQQYSAKTT
ncbi:MAG: hypothetical protein KA974_08995 [Saprospiraceae bacterium]|nr:hypothetical protein [Saprospiraceae bacterium]